LSDNDKEESISQRVSVRIPRKQYEMMRKFGETLGMNTDGGCLKHFLAIGLQASAAGIASVMSVETSGSTLIELRRMNDHADNHAKQLDLVEEASKPRARSRT
jgi:hypothetical protein